MNNFIEMIKARRSVRSYNERKVEEMLLREILSAGACAPSARNAQALTFTAVTSQDILARLNDAVKLFLAGSKDQFIAGLLQNPSFRFYLGAPVLVIISAAPDAFYPREDTGCAAENIMLAAHCAGLSSCWVNQLSGVGCDAPEIREVLSEIEIPPENKIFGSIVLGYSDKTPNPPPRKGNKIVIIK